MATIYLVTSGQYSDYGVNGVFSTRELAQQFINVMPHTYASYDIEEWELDIVLQFPPGCRLFSITIDHDGNCDVTEGNPTWGKSDDPPRPCMGTDRMGFYVWAPTKVHAAKIANERRVQLIANNEWTTDWHKWREEEDKKRPL